MQHCNAVQETKLSGILHAYIAFDWGEEIDLEGARQRISSQRHGLPRTSRTPPSISYHPLPLRIEVSHPATGLFELASKPEIDATVFDFAAVSVAIHIPFQLHPAELLRLAGRLAEPDPVVLIARQAVEPVYQALLPVIQNPRWGELGEEFFVFQIFPDSANSVSKESLWKEQAWLAGLVRLEVDALSPEEIAEALKQHASYGTDDLFVADWAAAMVLDRECGEILETIALANLQLLELREIDARLDAHLQTAYELTRRISKRRIPIWTNHSTPLRMMSELKVEVNEMLDRTTNVLKLIGDPYLARIYRLLASRFHLDEWGAGIHRSLDVLQSVHQVLSDQANTYRAESLEMTVVFLILVEIVLALLRH